MLHAQQALREKEGMRIINGNSVSVDADEHKGAFASA